MSSARKLFRAVEWQIVLFFAVFALIVFPDDLESDEAAGITLRLREINRFDHPWSVNPLNQDLLIVTQISGQLYLQNVLSGKKILVAGVPDVHSGIYFGLFDVVRLNSWDCESATVALSYVTIDTDGSYGGVVVLGTLRELDSATPEFVPGPEVFRQLPFSEVRGGFGLRLLVVRGDLWVTSGDRSSPQDVQSAKTSFGKLFKVSINRSNEPCDPSAWEIGPPAVVASGLRNPLGLAESNGDIWILDMGPKGGDELNLFEHGGNFGWPMVSEGDNYDGSPIPRHASDLRFRKPLISWVPSISPADIEFVNQSSGGDVLALVAALSGQALIVYEVNEHQLSLSRWHKTGFRIRSVAKTPDGKIYLLEDGRSTDDETRLFEILEY